MEVANGTALVAMRAALKHHCSGREGMTAQQVFDSLDTDDSGYVVCRSASTTVDGSMLSHFGSGGRYLDRDELEVAFGIFGAEQGQLLTAAEQEVAFTALDKDGDGEVSSCSAAVFQAWWKVRCCT